MPDIAMFIELKDKAAPSYEQKVWQGLLDKRGYKALIMPHNLKPSDQLAWLMAEVEQYLMGQA